MLSAPGSRARRIALVVLSAALVIIGAIALIAIGVAVYFAHRSVNATPPPATVAPPVTRAPMIPDPPATQDLVVHITSPVVGAHLFMGARDLGALPISLRQHELTGEPLIAVAAGHEPRIIRAELIIELMRTQPAYVIQLEETDAPDLVAYVRYTGQGLAHLPSGEDLGPVPGVVLIPVHEGEERETSIVVWDESGAESAPISLGGCSADRVCLLTTVPAP